jgi:hypothetical protein
MISHFANPQGGVSRHPPRRALPRRGPQARRRYQPGRCRRHRPWRRDIGAGAAIRPRLHETAARAALTDRRPHHATGASMRPTDGLGGGAFANCGHIAAHAVGVNEAQLRRPRCKRHRSGWTVIRNPSQFRKFAAPSSARETDVPFIPTCQRDTPQSSQSTCSRYAASQSEMRF